MAKLRFSTHRIMPITSCYTAFLMVCCFSMPGGGVVRALQVGDRSNARFPVTASPTTAFLANFLSANRSHLFLCNDCRLPGNLRGFQNVILHVTLRP